MWGGERKEEREKGIEREKGVKSVSAEFVQYYFCYIHVVRDHQIIAAIYLL